MPLIGVISDTHGLLRPEAMEALQGVDLIIHAGDIGSAKVIEELSARAPVSAVRGNCDRGVWADAFPESLSMTIEGVSIFCLGTGTAGFQHRRSDGRAESVSFKVAWTCETMTHATFFTLHNRRHWDI